MTSAESFISQDAPTLVDSEIENDFTNADPGPMHSCLSGTSPAPLNANQFDYSVSANEASSLLPDISGSGSLGGVFNLTPTTSYACVSQSGTSAGYLIWNAGSSSITVSGVTVPGEDAGGERLHVSTPTSKSRSRRRTPGPRSS